MPHPSTPRAVAGLVAGAVLGLMLMLAAGARASAGEETMMQDDNHLVYAPPAIVARTMAVMHSLGVDRIRVSVFWRIVAPAPDDQRRPAGFDPSDPEAYPPGAWARYDTIVRLARYFGLGLDFDITSPVPNWASVGTPGYPPDEPTYSPSPKEFAAFVAALGRRYSGTYVPPVSPGGPPDPLGALPRVSYWSIWNEPNQPGWLTPQSLPDPRHKGRFVDTAPRIYRRLVDAGAQALASTGHSQDTLLVGETAPHGAPGGGEDFGLEPLRFLRDLYCVDRRLRPLQGTAAETLGCPTANVSRAMPALHPALFGASGYAHHPYSLIYPPEVEAFNRDSVTIADLPRLERALDVIFLRYGRRRPNGVPVYLTEYGYQTKPPDPTQLFSPKKQGRFLNEADYIAFGDPRVQVLTQFLLIDDPPNTAVPPGSRYYWSTFQSGLAFADGRKKASFGAYKIPIWVPNPVVPRGRKATVWGLLRPAPNGTRQQATVQFRRRNGRRWRHLATVRVRSPRGSFTARVRVPGRGRVRIVWRSPTGTMFPSRQVAVDSR